MRDRKAEVSSQEDLIQALSRLLTALCLAAVLPAVASAQESLTETDPNKIIDIAEDVADSEFGLTSGSLFVAPIPRATPTLGNSVYLLGGYIFQADPGSRTSFLGAGTLFNSNGSQLNAFGGRLSLFSRKLQLQFGFSEGTLKYDTYVGDIGIPLRQDLSAYLLSIGFGITDELTFGAIGRYTDSLISLGGGALPPGFPAQDVDLEVLRYGLFAEYDSTDDDIFPREGWRINMSTDYGEIADGEDFWTALALIDHFMPIRDRDTLAMRLSICASGDDAPFFMECSLGRSDSFRGFEFFRYGGTALASFQAEYRGRLSKRFGYSVYGGVGSAADGFGNFSDAGWQAATGLGLRYQLVKRFPLDLGLDVTLNTESESYAYVFVGQGF